MSKDEKMTEEELMQHALYHIESARELLSRIEQPLLANVSLAELYLQLAQARLQNET